MNLKDLAARGVNILHRTVYDVSGGRILGGIAGMPVVELTTTGRKSGQPRTVMLTSPTRHEGNLVIVASYGGDDRYPAWFHNLVANPEVKVKAEGRNETRHARVATAEQRAVLWPQVTKAYKGYAGYQTRTDREIPLVILEP